MQSVLMPECTSGAHHVRKYFRITEDDTWGKRMEDKSYLEWLKNNTGCGMWLKEKERNEDETSCARCDNRPNR